MYILYRMLTKVPAISTAMNSSIEVIHKISCCSVTMLCTTLCHPMDCSTQASLSFTISWSLLKLTSIESVMPSNHHIFCRPFLLLPSIFPSISVFSNELGKGFGASASATVLQMNILGWFPLALTGLISLLSKRHSRVFSSTTVLKHQFLGTQPS